MFFVLDSSFRLAAGFAVMLTLAASGSAGAASSMEERKLAMRFTLNQEGPQRSCAPACRTWISAVGVITGSTVADFDAFAKGRNLSGAKVVFDSSGGSVNDAIALGRKLRVLKVSTTIGTTVSAGQTLRGRPRARILPEAYCESMCVFLMLAGVERSVPAEARVRVHQIWMGDRAEDAKASSYSAEDLMIVQRDIGRLAKYTFEMGGGGDLLSLALKVPPWEDLHTLTSAELVSSNLVTGVAMASVKEVAKPKAVQDRFVSEVVADSASVAVLIPVKALVHASAEPK